MRKFLIGGLGLRVDRHLAGLGQQRRGKREKRSLVTGSASNALTLSRNPTTECRAAGLHRRRIKADHLRLP